MEELMIEGVVENIVYQNEDNGYTVFEIIDEKDNDEIVCVGYISKIICGETIKLSGSYVTHPSYGVQFKVVTYDKSTPTTKMGIEKYLASGLIKGIGAKMAKKIVTKFGEDTLKIIEENPKALADIRGITVKKAEDIGRVFHEQIDSREVMIFLQGYGITPLYAMKIYKKYKKEAFDIVKNNPYKLADEISGISFKLADSIAEKAGVETTSPFRIMSGIRYVITMASYNGHTYLPKEILINNSRELLLVSRDQIEEYLLEMQMDKIITQKDIDGEMVVYSNTFFYSENYIAKKLMELSMHQLDKKDKIDEEIKIAEKKIGITLDKEQKVAVSEAMSQGVLVITGGPGTGKTTTINTIIEILENESYEVLLAAPTGRAAKRMTETTGREAKTIHRLLEISFLDKENSMQFVKNEDEPLEADVIILDETSMVDTMLMYHFLKAVPQGTRVILVGDVDQLPSVGAGNVLRDIIKSQCIKVVSLKEIFRQAAESQIIINAHKINNGEYPVLNESDSDFYFVECENPDKMVDGIVGLVTQRLPKFKNCSGFSDIQVLTAMRKSSIGVHNLNQVLQEKLNPPDDNKEERAMKSGVLREGDKVMQIKNNYNLIWKNTKEYDEYGKGIFNGDEGIIKKIDKKAEIVKVIYDDYKEVEYDYTQLDEIELSYAITIHKSQGSEYKVVVIPVHNGPPMLMTRNLLYTAVTRGKELVVVIGSRYRLNGMVDNNKEFNRYSSLDIYINSIAEFMKE